MFNYSRPGNCTLVCVIANGCVIAHGYAIAHRLFFFRCVARVFEEMVFLCALKSVFYHVSWMCNRTWVCIRLPICPICTCECNCTCVGTQLYMDVQSNMDMQSHVGMQFSFYFKMDLQYVVRVFKEIVAVYNCTWTCNCAHGGM